MPRAIFRIILLPIVLFTAACAPVQQSASVSETQVPQSELAESEPASADDDAPEALEHIDLGVGFIPNIQFAPYYVAQANGFFAEEGLEVVLEYGFENDFVTLTAQGERQFAIASGDQVILARAQGLPLVYVMKWYQRFPVALMTLSESEIDLPQKLEGQSVGVPGLFGATYVAWEALAYAAGLDKDQIDLQEIGFTQAEAVSQKQVDAAMVYIANEPIQLSQAGQPVNVIEVSDYIDLVSNGLVTNETLLADNPDLVGRMVRASLKGIDYTINNPDEAFEISRAFIPEMTDEDAPTQRLVLEASIELWRSDQPGFSNPQAWTDSAAFMLETGLIVQEIEVDDLFTNEFVEN